MDEDAMAKTLADLADQEAALAAQEQTPDVARQRKELLMEIQKILKEVKGGASAQDAQ